MSENNQFEFLWKQIQGVMQEMISPITYEMYISKLVPVDIEETKIVLKTDTEFFANYIGTKLADTMKSAIRKANTGITDFELMVEGKDDVVFTSVEDFDDDDDVSGNLNPRYTFDSFVAGKSNDFVFAAAQSVAKTPRRISTPCTYTALRDWAKPTFCSPSPTISICINLPYASSTPPAISLSTNSSIPFTSIRAETAGTSRRDSGAAIVTATCSFWTTCSSSPKSRRCRKNCSTRSTNCNRRTNRSCSRPTCRPRRSQRSRSASERGSRAG